MKKSLRHGAGFLQIDHRDSPGLTPEQVAHVPGAMAVAGGTILERDVLQCSHCQRAVVLEPLRTRDRGHCPKCHHYICDSCETIRAKTGACVPVNQTLDRMQEMEALGRGLENHLELPAPEPAVWQSHEAHLRNLLKQADERIEAEDADGAYPFLRELIDSNCAKPQALHAMGLVRQQQGYLTEACDYLRRAIALDPTIRNCYETLVMFCDIDPKPIVSGSYMRRLWWERFGVKEWARHRPPTNNRNPDRPIRVGYVSADFFNHSASCGYRPIILNHTEGIEPFYYSSTEKPDGVTEEFSSRPGWRNALGKTDDELHDKIREDKIDILVDLSNWSTGNRLGIFARKPAPIQITAWGYAHGLEWPAGIMDYLFADPVFIPEADRKHYTERIVYMPSVILYAPPEPSRPVSPLPMLTNGYPTFGALARAMKINDDVLRVWRTLLERMPDARLIVKGIYVPSRVQTIKDALAPVLDRVTIEPNPENYGEYSSVYDRIDIQLDTWPQAGGAASWNALWHGIPIITLIGESSLQRGTASLLTQVALTTCIADTEEEYIELAREWVSIPLSLSAIRGRLREECQSRLAEMHYLEAVETFYRAAWREWCSTTA